MGSSISKNTNPAPLLQPCMEGNMEEVKRLVGRHIGSDKSSLSDFVDASDDQGNAAVHGCAFAGHLSILQFLVEDCGADALSVRNDLGCTPLWLAAGYGHLDVLKYLLGRIEAVSSLVISPAEIVMGENSTGDSPLLAATSRGHVEVCRLILQAVDKYSGEQGEGSANAIRRTNQNGDTPLAVAVGAGHADELLDLFLQRDACICTTEDRALNMRNKNGLTPLLVACERNLAPIALKLIEAGALPLSDSNGASPLAVAAFCGCDDVVEALLNIEFGKQLLNKQDDSGKCTPLWLAARTGNAKMVRLLLDAGADATLTNIDGLTPEEAAVKYDKKKVMEVFGYDIQEVTQEENAAVDDSNQ